MRNVLLALASLFCCMNVCAQHCANDDYMVKAMWGQGFPYNILCPVMNNGTNALAGCGATAVAQILYCYQLPEKGFSRVQYDNIDLDLGQCPIDWENITPVYDDKSSQTERNAVANLMRVVGAAMKMKYGEKSSSVNEYNCMLWGLQHFLHISSKARYRRRCHYSTAEWTEMLCSELDNKKPVFYRGDHTRPDTAMAGHMFVIDGHDKTSVFHANYGHAEKYQIRWVDLNLLNQGDNTNPGTGGVCYHHKQAMVTDLKPIKGLDDNDFDPINIIVDSHFTLGGNNEAETVEATNAVSVKCNMKLASFNGGYIEFTVGFYRNDILEDVSSSVKNHTFPDKKVIYGPYISYKLPKSLPDGNYDMCLVARKDENAPWLKAWDNAPNRVPVTVKNGKYSFHLLPSHSRDCHLCLSGAIKEVSGPTGGRTFEFTVCNPSENNFEDSIRICVKNKGREYVSHQVTSVYDGQRIKYRFFFNNSKADFSPGYTVSAFYRETNSAQWLPLSDKQTGMATPSLGKRKCLAIYNTGGLCLKKWETTPAEKEYADFLNGLQRGLYIISDANGTRKFTKTH